MNRRDLILGGAALTALAPRISRAAAPAAASMRAQRLSWAGVKLVCGQTTLFIDASIGSPADVPLNADTPARFALATHHHGDHCDPDALEPVLGQRGVLVAHREVARYVNPKGLQLQAVDLHEPVFLSRGTGDFVARAVPAVDGLGSPQVSWVVDGAGRKILHCGDTLWHGYWWDIARAYGPFDVVFLPINGFRQTTPRFTATGMPMSLTPEQAVAAARTLGARLACPIHYGRGEADYVEVPKALEQFQDLAHKAALPARALSPGEWMPV